MTGKPDDPAGGVKMKMGRMICFRETKMRFSSIHQIMNALFFAINWTRELVNAFSTQAEPELKGHRLFA